MLLSNAFQHQQIDHFCSHIDGDECILIAGPTASGKSLLALEIAKKISGEIINCDSMQLYKGLPILTACPDERDYEIIAHHMYQILDDDFVTSAAWWVRQANKICDDIRKRGKVPIIVGGTGMYLYSFEYGISNIPEIDTSIRNKIREELVRFKLEHMYKKLKLLDPQSNVSPNDTQRILRSLEVIESTGKTISYWHRLSKNQSNIKNIKKILLMPEKNEMLKNARERWHKMQKFGVISQTESWLIKNSTCNNRALYKAVGVKEIAMFLKGEITSIQLEELVMIATNQYIKKQRTWFSRKFIAT